MGICALCGINQLPEGKTIKGRFYCSCGREWILEKRKVKRISIQNASEQKSNFILSCVALFNSTLDIKKLIDDFADQLFYKFDKKNIGILLIDTERSKIELANYKTQFPKYKRILSKIALDYDLSLGVLVKSMTETSSIFYDIDTQNHPFYKFYKNLTGTQYQLVIPIHYGNTPFGILTMDYIENNPDKIKEDKELLEILSGQFAIALRNSQLYERSKKQSIHFQNLHVSALTLSKLYLDNYEEMLRMILLTSSSFVDAQESRLYEFNPHANPTGKFTVYELLKDPKNGFIVTNQKVGNNWEEKKKEFQPDGFVQNKINVSFLSENNIHYTLEFVNQNHSFTRDDFEVINAFVALSKITIDNSFLYENLSQRKSYEREIEIAKEIQQALLPNKTPHFENFDLAGIMIPARGVGGDYYDFIVSPDKEEVVICIGDVSGKGVGAGMVMATVRTILHSLVRKKPSPAELIMDINTYLYYNYKDSPTSRFMTMTLIKWNPPSNEFVFAGAGHGSLYHFQFKNQNIVPIESKGFILGIKSNIEKDIYQSKVTLEPGDSLLLVTDGVTEAISPNGTFFEEENLIKSFINSNKTTAKSILDSIIEDLKAFTNGKEQQDDLTLVCILHKC